MRIAVVTLFPDMIRNAIGYGVVGRALDRKLLELDTINPRDYAADRHRTVDDRPYGGGPGMVMMVEPLTRAIRAAKAGLLPGAVTVCMSAQGVPLDQAGARKLADLPGMVLVAGRYEGIDERVLDSDVDLELSIGDYVLSGGELPALVVMDSVIRLLPEVLGGSESAEQDSFEKGLLDCPHYTRPEEIEGRKVPEVLLGGNHAAIRRWRLKQSLGRTWLRRPDLLRDTELNEEQKMLLDEFIADREGGEH